jgi:hypothetical protein
MMDERMDKYTVRLSKVASKKVLRSYESIRKVSIEQGNKPPSLSQFMAGLIFQSVTDQDETKEISYA